ncbi:MAG: hypothetical protein D4R48_00310 [Nitrosomonadales bacterium]|nr:MAG: hypothetical protein D4R48_00310 [Nitrosomonadales bacterium]
MKANFKPMVAAVVGTLLFGATQVAMADSTDDLLKKLHDKGVLNDEEYDSFNASRDTEKVKKTSEIKASFKDGIQWQSGDGATKFSVNGRIQADYRSFDVPEPASTATANAAAANNGAGGVPDNFDIRRAYLTAKGTFYNYMNFEATLDGKNGSPALKYYWLEMAPMEEFKVRFGQFKMPSGLETWVSSRFNDMTERDWVSNLTPSIQKGIMVHGIPTKGLYYFASVSNGSVGYEGGQTTLETNSNADGKEWGERLVVNLAQVFNMPDTILHFGETYSKDTDLPDTAAGDITMQTNARGTTFFKSNLAFVNPDIRRYGLETILARGPVKLQAEYGSYELQPTGSATTKHEINASYVNLSWLVTGESYSDAYKDSLMDRIRPKNDFVAIGAPGFGAIELGARYSRFDASDFTQAQLTAGQTADKAHSYTLGVKWIPNPNTRFLMDYVHTHFDQSVTGGITNVTSTFNDENAINFRAQLDF